jgi:hypothetical protein
VRPYTPPERPAAGGSAPPKAPSPQHQPPPQPHHFDRPRSDKPQQEQHKTPQLLSNSDRAGQAPRPEQRSRRTEPERAGSHLNFAPGEGGRVVGKPMDIREALKARREAGQLGWSDFATDYDAQFRQQWQRFRHEGDIKLWKEMGERSAISAAGAVGGMAGGALAGAAAAGVGLTGIAEAVAVGSFSGMAGSAASSGTEIGFGERMTAGQFGVQVAIGGAFGGLFSGLGAGLFGPKPLPQAPVPPPEAPVIGKWTELTARFPPLKPNIEGIRFGRVQPRNLPREPGNAYYHFGATKEIVASREVIGAPTGRATGMPDFPAARALRGPLTPHELSEGEWVEFTTYIEARRQTFMFWSRPNQGAEWVPEMVPRELPPDMVPAIRTEWRENVHLRFKGHGEVEHAVVDIFVLRYRVFDPATGQYVIKVPG